MLTSAIRDRIAKNQTLRLLKATLHDLDKGRYYTARNTIEVLISSMELAEAADSFTVVPTAESDDVAVAHV